MGKYAQAYDPSSEDLLDWTSLSSSRTQINHLMLNRGLAWVNSTDHTCSDGPTRSDFFHLDMVCGPRSCGTKSIYLDTLS